MSTPARANTAVAPAPKQVSAATQTAERVQRQFGEPLIEGAEDMFGPKADPSTDQPMSCRLPLGSKSFANGRLAMRAGLAPHRAVDATWRREKADDATSALDQPVVDKGLRAPGESVDTAPRESPSPGP